jgi:hypothetical protein
VLRGEQIIHFGERICVLLETILVREFDAIIINLEGELVDTSRLFFD